MPQTLSAMKYVKNNKRRVSVLIVSLSLCAVLFYLTQFLLSTATETFGSLLIKNAEKAQYISLPSSAFGLDYQELGEEEFLRQYDEKHLELAEKLKQQSGVKEVYLAQINYAEIAAVVGQYYVEVPMLSKKDVSTFMKHFGAELKEGRLPERDNEIILDEKIMKNSSYQIGDSLLDYSNTKIVGVAECDFYFGCGVYEGDTYNNEQLCILSDGSIVDYAALLHKLGYEFKDSDARIVDKKTGEHRLQIDIVDSLEPSSKLIYIGIISILSLALLIVYTSYLRDRRNEWCLYCSIGFSRKTIYFSIMRELLFTFGFALLAGGIVTAGSVVVLDHTLIASMGLQCRYFYPDVLWATVCSYALILGILQMPIRYALYKIRTIDAMDDDLM